MFEQVQPVPDADTNVTPAGSVSVTVRFAASDGPLLTTASEYVTVPPATTVGGPVLVIARSADAVTVVTAVEVLLPGTGSAVVEATDAVFDNDPAWAGAVTVTVIVGAVAPVASAARVQVTETLPGVRAGPAGAGRGHERHARGQRVRHRQVRRVGRAGVGDRSGVYATEPAATTVAGPVFVIARFAEAVTVVEAVEVLLAAFGSAVVDAIDAVFDSDAAWPGAVTVTVIVGAVAPVARVGRVQVTETLPVFEQVHPVPVALTRTSRPAGRVSVTVSALASEGPLFDDHQRVRHRGARHDRRRSGLGDRQVRGRRHRRGRRRGVVARHRVGGRRRHGGGVRSASTPCAGRGDRHRDRGARSPARASGACR